MGKLKVDDTIGDLVDVAYRAFCDIADSFVLSERLDSEKSLADDFFSDGGDGSYVGLGLGVLFRQSLLSMCRDKEKFVNGDGYDEDLFRRDYIRRLGNPSEEMKVKDYL
tara:strand:+ start:828 stop:1154 length:327 start_codon:yes stop_codon:yes gene_type:complete